MLSKSLCALNIGAITLLSAMGVVPAFAISIDTVLVGNAGNAADLRDDDHGTPDVQNFGAVGYEYRIGKYEVTNAQYVEFLNAKAKSNGLGLYSTVGGGNARGGITRVGTNGNYSYSTKPNMSDKPVNFVNFYDAIRFANWMNNGQGDADTETGAYTLLGGTSIPENADNITRNPGSTWVIPTEDEWYKAAYHQPAADGGPTGDYWAYPTATNELPTIATANSVGDISNPGPHVVNYSSGADWNGVDGNVTTVGSAGPSSAGYYGTFDQGGNVLEWNEPLVDIFRIARGGEYRIGLDAVLLSSSRPKVFATDEIANIGFRLVMIPEPSTLALAGIGGLALLVCAMRRHSI